MNEKEMMKNEIFYYSDSQSAQTVRSMSTGYHLRKYAKISFAQRVLVSVFLTLFFIGLCYFAVRLISSYENLSTLEELKVPFFVFLGAILVAFLVPGIILTVNYFQALRGLSCENEYFSKLIEQKLNKDMYKLALH